MRPIYIVNIGTYYQPIDQPMTVCGVSSSSRVQFFFFFFDGARKHPTFFLLYLIMSIYNIGIYLNESKTIGKIKHTWPLLTVILLTRYNY